MKSDYSFEFRPASENTPPLEDREPGTVNSNLYEAQRPWPLINAEESRFIENTGGEYIGFVGTEDGRRQFEDLRITRCAYYDEQERAVVEGFIATEGVNDEGTNELSGPDEVVGFTLLMIKKDLSGHELGQAEIISLQPANFPHKHLDIKDLGRLAREVHDFIVQDVSRLGSSQAFRRAKARLETEGWQGDRAFNASV